MQHTRLCRTLLKFSTIVLMFSTTIFGLRVPEAQAQPVAKKPNILVIFGDDIGQANLSAYSHGVMGYRTPNIDRIAKEGMMFTDYSRRTVLYGRSVELYYRTGNSANGSLEGRHAGRDGRFASARCNPCPVATAIGIRHWAVWQKSSRRSQ